MEVRTAIATRRVVRAFDDRPLGPEALHAILDAGRRAGSAKNRQRWDFIVVGDREPVDRVREAPGADAEVGDMAQTGRRRRLHTERVAHVGAVRPRLHQASGGERLDRHQPRDPGHPLARTTRT